MTALNFQNVRKTFGPTVALQSLDLAVLPGELISLLGPSGSGKTTALRIAAGFERADRGVVMLGGEDITTKPAHKRNMGMVFQSYSLFPNLTVALNVDFGLRARKLAKYVRTKRVTDMLELVQLAHLAGHYPHQLTGAQQQRVALARALAIQPEVLLLDEPLSALDAKDRLSIRDEIRRIQTSLGVTTLLVTHDQEDALGVSDRVGVMSQGHLEQLATPNEVYANPASAFVARFVGSMNEFPASVLDVGAVEVMGTVVRTQGARDHEASSNVTLLVRPEDLSLSNDPTISAVGSAGLVGSVTTCTFQGVSTVVRVRLDVLDTLVSVHLASTSAAQFAPGQRVLVAIDGTRAVCESKQSPTSSSAA